MTEPDAQEPTTILVVDDDPSVRRFLKSALRKKGHRVVAAATGQEAVPMVFHQQVDIVLIDVKMPGLSGTQTLRHLLEVDPSLAVIMLTGYGSIATAREAMRLGAYDYLTKPFDPAYLEEAIADSLHLKQKSVVVTKQ